MLESRAQTLRSRTAQLAQSESNEKRVNDALGRQKGATDRALRDLELARARVVSLSLSSPTPTLSLTPTPTLARTLARARARALTLTLTLTR